MRELTGRTAFISGGGQGIGLGIARALAQQGAKLALADIDDDALRAAEAELSTLTTVEAFHLDVRDRAAYARIADEAEQRLGPVSVLCNNAGIAFPESVADMAFELWDLAVDINLGGVINGIQTFLPRMLERGTPAHIVNTASAAGLVAAAGFMYTCTKFAVVGLSESLRNRLAEAGVPIGVTVLCPGAVTTNLARSTSARIAAQQGDAAYQRARSRIEQLIPNVEATLERYGTTPDAVGALVLDAITENQLYVHTDRAGIDLITARTDAILAAMPEAPSAGTFEQFRGSVYER